MEKARDNSSMELGKSQEQKGGHSGSTKRQKESPLCHKMGLCHLKNAELEPKSQKHTGRVVLRGDIVKDDSGADAAFIEQGSSTSQMTAAKVIDVIARLPDCDGQASDAASAYTQVKLEDAPRLLKIPKSECPDVWIRLPQPISLGDFSQCMWDDIKMAGKNQNMAPMWKKWMKNVDLDEPTSFLDPVYSRSRGTS